jgi:hypothetical protein
VQGASPAEELERAVCRGETEARLRAPCALEELDRRERPVERLDRVEDGAALGSHPGARRKRELLGHRRDFT